ncbi:microtubule-associated protein futsch-like isoform X2 [Vidua macroura]|uniref:microtubule-associated protein futsch-like isoform X2 n=1 Tax=Vidua macroura TaxID=187451 RepID=UPI0023A817BA|nr:microtubule-associated protein futsch-like isoform X2 [Vidua macroura]XP_053831738.1 microtubule-associated protein futsch-like isoform X2 [Vidua macroura]
MSSRQRKRPGGAIDSRPARKRSRLLPSSAGGTSQTEPRDLEESATAAFEPAGGEFLDLTGDSSELEVIAISIDESPVDSQQSQQQPHLSRASENSAEPLARNDEEEPREDDGAWSAGPASPPMGEGDNSQVQDKDQSQQYPLGSRDTENSVEVRASDSEEEPRDSNEYVTDEESLQSAISDTSAWTARLVSPPTCEDDNAESQQDPLDSSAAENAAEVLANESEEEPQDIESSALSSDWLLFDFDLPYWSDEDSEAREQNQQHSHFSTSAENSAGPLTAHDKEEPKDNDCAWTAGPASPPMKEGDNSQVQDREQSQQYPLGSREAENSAELWASDSEEEPRYNDDSINSDEWPDRFESPPTWQDDITDDWEESQQYPLHSRSAENSLELLASNLQQEPRDIEFEPPRGFISPPNCEDDNAEQLFI